MRYLHREKLRLRFLVLLFGCATLSVLLIITITILVYAWYEVEVTGTRALGVPEYVPDFPAISTVILFLLLVVPFATFVFVAKLLMFTLNVIKALKVREFINLVDGIKVVFDDDNEICVLWSYSEVSEVTNTVSKLLLPNQKTIQIKTKQGFDLLVLTGYLDMLNENLMSRLHIADK
jgi:hypothetical protein